jgi:hypothetical protein
LKHWAKRNWSQSPSLTLVLGAWGEKYFLLGHVVQGAKGKLIPKYFDKKPKVNQRRLISRNSTIFPFLLSLTNILRSFIFLFACGLFFFFNIYIYIYIFLVEDECASPCRIEDTAI